MHVRELIDHESLYTLLIYLSYSMGTSQSALFFVQRLSAFSWSLDPQISADVSRWTVETNIVFLRILIGCIIGAMLVFLY